MIRQIISDYHIKDFSPDEITHNQTDIPEKYIMNIIPTLCILQRIRTQIENPILILSTYRSPEYNKKVGGASRSLHLVFNAIDFTPFEYNCQSLRRLFEQICMGRFCPVINYQAKVINVTPNKMGVGLYRSFIHIDTRGLLGRKAPACWQGSNMNPNP